MSIFLKTNLLSKPSTEHLKKMRRRCPNCFHVFNET